MPGLPIGVVPGKAVDLQRREKLRCRLRHNLRLSMAASLLPRASRLTVRMLVRTQASDEPLSYDDLAMVAGN